MIYEVTKYRIKLLGESYELPKYTLDIAEKCDNYEKVSKEYDNNDISIREFAREGVDFIVSVLGHDSLIKLFGSADIGEIDLKRLDGVCCEIVCRYAQETIATQANTRMKTIDPLLQLFTDNRLKTAMSNFETVAKVNIASDVVK